MTAFSPRSARGGLTIAPGEIQVWSARLDPPADRVEELGRTLSPDERQRAERFRFDVHRRRFIVGRGVLRALLSGYLGIPADRLRFVYADRGKPDLAPDLATTAGGTPFFFNLSHSEDLALYAFVLGREVGVDVEYKKAMPDLHQIAERFFSATENEALARLPEDQHHAAFFNCWTRKEAYLKAVGVGLAAPLDSFDVTLAPGEPARMLCLEGDVERGERWVYHHLDPAPGYVGAVAIEGRDVDWRVSAWELAL